MLTLRTRFAPLRKPCADTARLSAECVVSIPSYIPRRPWLMICARSGRRAGIGSIQANNVGRSRVGGEKGARLFCLVVSPAALLAPQPW